VYSAHAPVTHQGCFRIELKQSYCHSGALSCLHELVPGILSKQDNAGYTATHFVAVHGHVDALQCFHDLEPGIPGILRNSPHAPLGAPAQWLQFCHWLQALHSETAACTSRNTINIGPKILGSL